MKTNFDSPGCAVTTVRLLCAGTYLILFLTGLGASVRAQTQTNLAEAPARPPRPVTAEFSAFVRNDKVYSIQFPGGSAEHFFEFLRTNGFATDNVLFAGEAGQVHVPPFTIRHVRLGDVAKALELVSEDRLKVEVITKGQESDENIWHIRSTPEAANISARTCAMPHFFQRSDVGRLQPIIDAAESTLMKSGARKTGFTRMLAREKIVIVIGPAAYVEAVSSALEAIEKVAAAEAESQKMK